MIDLSIIIPAYNEEDALADSVSSAISSARQSECSYEIIIVNDFSTDKTPELAEKLSEDFSEVRVVHNETNLGLGGAYRAGLFAAKGKHVTWIPGDNSQSIEGLVAVYRLTGSNDIIVPYVLNQEARPFGRRLVSRLFTLVVNIMFNLRIPYYNAPAVHCTDLVKKIGIETDSFGFQAEILVKLIKAGKKYSLVGITIVDRQEGESKAFYLKNIIGVLGALFILAKRVYFSPSLLD